MAALEVTAMMGAILSPQVLGSKRILDRRFSILGAPLERGCARGGDYHPQGTNGQISGAVRPEPLWRRNAGFSALTYTRNTF